MQLRILIAMLVSIGFAVGQESADAALDRFAKIGIFAFGGVGYAGVRSKGETYYRVVYSHPSALAEFGKLLVVGTPAAKLYALTAIRRLDPKHFGQVARPFRDSDEDVAMEVGCIIHHEKFGVILKGIEAGRYISLPEISSARQ
jgi:hypothetical protein